MAFTQTELESIYFTIGGILHEARMQECYGNLRIQSRNAWPTTLKEFRTQRHLGQPWIDVAIAQVKALLEANLVNVSAQP